ncbi:MAG: sn-glycerol-3-phosphate ABC transporter ATP-binding protein UgpC [Clostridia bacterium]|nr:sn-glycerol-3-phosphate ABC transporter ATP-binding protein UgpC [Clostridia bacterium]
MASISLKNIYKIFEDGTTAVRDFTLEIEDKEFIILVGPSGCGKSTTLRMIAGLESISKGEMKIGESVVNSVAPKDRDIAMVFQSYALYPHMSVYRNMAFGLELRKIPKDEIDRRVREAAKILDIEHLLKRKPRALSGGQRQRVALGRAMVRSPSVFLLDEPLSNLDAKLRTTMRTQIKKLHKRLGTTFIYVTHDQTEAMTMGDRIVVMKDGVIQQADTPQQLYDKPFNMFVAGFIGSPQMNFLDAVVSIRDGRIYLILADNEINVTSALETRKSIYDFDGRSVKLGIRPEDIINDADFVKNNADKVITASVEVNEMMGSETYLYLDYSGEKIVARVSAPAAEGQTASLAIRTEKIHLFDPATTMNILL